jgi:glycosyltransferase involved in cell wall biosynthesis
VAPVNICESEKELSTGTYDLVHIEPFYVYPSLPDISVPLVVGEHNIEYMVYGTYARTSGIPVLRPLMLADVKKLRFWEEQIWKKATTVVTVSPPDARVVAMCSKRPVTVVPNGVDIRSIPYISHAFDPKRKTFLFVGNFSWTPNIEAVRTLLTSLWPVIFKKYPEAKLTVAGRNFPAFLRSRLTDGVSVREDISDIRDIYAGNDILLAPMGIPGGTKFKLLEAMASGTAVITTKDGSMGLDVTAGTHVWEAESTEDMIRAIGDIYASPDKTRQRTRQARELVEQKYDWNSIAKKLDDVWKISV